MSQPPSTSQGQYTLGTPPSAYISPFTTTLVTNAPVPAHRVLRSGIAAPTPACRSHAGAYGRAGRIPPGRRTGAAFGEEAEAPPPSSAAAAAGSAPGMSAARPRALRGQGPSFLPENSGRLHPSSLPLWAACAPSVPLQRGIERDETGRNGMGRQNEPMRDQGVSR